MVSLPTIDGYMVVGGEYLSLTLESADGVSIIMIICPFLHG
jgi:hypothetical protein